MGVTLRQVLDLDVLRRAGIRVVSGAEQLDRPVRWVHIGELPDIAHLLNGGELLLTTGMGITRNPNGQRRYVAEIAGAGAAGLVIELGRTFDEVPLALAQAARQHTLPLIALERETRYVEVTEAVHRAIINHQYELLRQAESVSRDFTDLILDGAGVAQIITRLATVLGSPVVLEDAAGHVLELAGSSTDSVLGLWGVHAPLPHPADDRGTVRRCQSRPRCQWIEVWLRQEPWGRVHVLETAGAPDDITGLVLDRAGAALGLALLAQQDDAHLAGRAGSALLADVLSGRHGTLTEFLRRAGSLGADLDRGRLVALAVEATSLAELARRNALPEEERQRIRLRIAEALSGAAQARDCPALVGLDGDRVLAMIAVTGPDPVPKALEMIVAEASGRGSGAGRSLTIVAGAGREVAVTSLRQSLVEATEALNQARKAGAGAGAGPTVCHFADLGTYQLLLRLAQDPELARFVDSELGPLLRHDTQNRAVLLPTLRSYLGNAGRKAETVRELRIQRRTLYARLARIERILGQDLGSQDARTRLTLAIQGHDLLRDRDRDRGDRGRDSRPY